VCRCVCVTVCVCARVCVCVRVCVCLHDCVSVSYRQYRCSHSRCVHGFHCPDADHSGPLSYEYIDYACVHYSNLHGIYVGGSNTTDGIKSGYLHINTQPKSRHCRKNIIYIKANVVQCLWIYKNMLIWILFMDI
jgi:hypothetical protein